MNTAMNGLAPGDSEASITKKVQNKEETMGKDHGSPTSAAGSASGSLISDILNNSGTDLSSDDENENDDEVSDSSEASDYNNSDVYWYADDDYDAYAHMQAQFDNVHFPPGVEVSVSWLDGPAPAADALVDSSISAQGDSLDLSAGVGTSSSSSTVLPAESSSGGEENPNSEDNVLQKFELFRQFDTVDEFPDHHFIGKGFSGQKPPKSWAKKVQKEWKILEKNLPETIYVRVSERRIDLLRAIIVGPAGTPYHDGLFVFDFHFPPSYPQSPPMVYYYSGGLRLNPNLYGSGKVCLSLLNTWSGNKNEIWMPKKSTMLQVLVSLQALVLNAKPFFNEPGHETAYVGVEGERQSKVYNEHVFVLSLKTMIYTLQRPPKHFEDFVAGHFRVRARDIISACKAYTEGAEIGSSLEGITENSSEVSNNGWDGFQEAVAKMMNVLVTNFVKNGSLDCEEFHFPS